MKRDDSALNSGDVAGETGSVPLPGGAEAGVNACWKATGVFGDGSCPELRRVVHCRNCPVFAEAGASFLDRPLPRDYRKEWTDHFSRSREPETPGNVSAVVFRILQEWFALPTAALLEIAELRTIHSLPHRRSGVVLGVANVRGELLVCVSLVHAFDMRSQPPDDARHAHHRLLVASWNGDRFGFPVHDVAGTERFQMQDVRPPPAGQARPEQPFTKGLVRWQRWSVSLLDPDLLFPALNERLM